MSRVCYLNIYIYTSIYIYTIYIMNNKCVYIHIYIHVQPNKKHKHRTQSNGDLEDVSVQNIKVIFR